MEGVHIEEQDANEPLLWCFLLPLLSLYSLVIL